MDNTLSPTRAMEEQDLPQVAKIFSEQFPKSPWTRLGPGFICQAFRWHLENFPQLALVSQADGQVTGFIIGTQSTYREYYHRIARSAFKEYLLGILRHPQLLFQRLYFTQFIDLFKNQPSTRNTPQDIETDKTTTNKAILTFVAVSKAYVGKGFGKHLLHAYEQAAQKEGFEVLSLYTELDNHPARKLYENHGWAQSHINAQRNLIYYSKRLNKSL